MTFVRMLLLVMGVGLGVLPMASCGASQESGVQELYILSPHGAEIRREFAEAFEKWHQEKYGSRVVVQWPDLGGTSTIIKYLQAQGEGKGIADLMWGGGSGTFDDLTSKGLLIAPNPPVSEEVLKRVPAGLFPDEEGKFAVRLREREGRWYGATMSYFGIVVNKDRLREKGMEKPRTWEDLAGPGYIAELSLADPSKSGSVRTCFENVLQQYGWEKGWSVLTRMFANTDVVREGGAFVSEDVGAGNVTAAVAIDFYCRLAIMKQGPKVAEFIVPEGGSTLDSDPIGVLKGAPNPELATRFIEFVLSPEGQRLWTHRPGTPGGPKRKPLGRMAMIPELYETEAEYMTDPTNPFTSPKPLQTDRKAQQLRSRILGELLRVAFIDPHAELAAARKAVREKGDPPELLAMFNLLPFAADELPAVAAEWSPKEKERAEKQQSALREKWGRMYRERWEEIRRRAEGE